MGKCADVLQNHSEYSLSAGCMLVRGTMLHRKVSLPSAFQNSHYCVYTR